MAENAVGGARCCTCTFFTAQERDAIGIQAVKFEKILIINFLLSAVTVALTITLLSLTNESQNMLPVIVAVLIWMIHFIGFLGAWQRNQTFVVVWLCVQGCYLCCGVITMVVLITSVAAVAARFEEGGSDDLTPSYENIARDEKTDTILGVLDIIFNFLSFVTQVVATAFGLQLNTMLSGGPPAQRMPIVATHNPQRRGMLPQMLDANGNLLQLGARDDDPEAVAMALLASSPVTMYDLYGKPCAIAVPVSQSEIDDLLLPDPELEKLLSKKQRGEPLDEEEAGLVVKRRGARESSTLSHSSSNADDDDDTPRRL